MTVVQMQIRVQTHGQSQLAKAVMAPTNALICTHKLAMMVVVLRRFMLQLFPSFPNLSLYFSLQLNLSLPE